MTPTLEGQRGSPKPDNSTDWLFKWKSGKGEGLHKSQPSVDVIEALQPPFLTSMKCKVVKKFKLTTAAGPKGPNPFSASYTLTRSHLTPTRGLT